ncbi:MAG: pentapeptide repeat-containing protein [Anaerolineales bacterium]|nr:pentapeptide repeat-containing protein [Anaerolineales bacterium]
MASEMLRSRRRKRYLQVVIIWAVIIGLGALIAWMGYLQSQGYPWMDFTGFEGKTTWDVLELLIIPVTLAGVAAYLNILDRKTDRELILDNQRETALQNYFDAMTRLILDKNLRNSKPEDDVRDIAQAKTITTLERLDIDRKSKLVRFLSEASLVVGGKEILPIIKLAGANLVGVDLGNANLAYANLRGADLRSANLWSANLEGAKLWSANLAGAKLWSANLVGANLRLTNLMDAYLRDAYLLKANHLEEAYLENATMPDGNEYDPAIHTIEKLTAPKARGELLRNN